jgi:hypothetical protein
MNLIKTEAQNIETIYITHDKRRAAGGVDLSARSCVRYAAVNHADHTGCAAPVRRGNLSRISQRILLRVRTAVHPVFYDELHAGKFCPKMEPRVGQDDSDLNRTVPSV